MKTAMQELLEWHRKSMRSYSETNKMIEAFFEKENKQIMDSWKEGTNYIMDINDGKNIPSMSAIDYLIYFKTEKTDYYITFIYQK